MFDDNEPFDFNEEFVENCFKLPKQMKEETQTKKRSNTSKSDALLEILNVNKKTKTVERKFPGPAGLLNVNPEFLEKQHQKDENVEDQEEILCSQVTATTFESGLWYRMWKDFQPLPDLFSISFIKKNSRINTFPMQRVPFLTGIIENIDTCGKSGVTVTLKDKFDRITGSIHGTTIDEYENQFIEGSVLVLKSVGILTSRKSKICHIIIMKSNIIACYCKIDEHFVPFNGNLKEFVENNILIYNKLNEDIAQNKNNIFQQNDKTVGISKNNYLICDKPEDSDLLKSIFEDLDPALFDNEF